MRFQANKYFWKIVKSFRYDFRVADEEMPRFASKEERKTEIEGIIDEWIERLEGQSLHGGLNPDAADFRFYAELARVETLPLMKKIIA